MSIFGSLFARVRASLTSPPAENVARPVNGSSAAPKTTDAAPSAFASLRQDNVGKRRTAGEGLAYLAICDVDGLSALKRQFRLVGADDPMRQVVELIENMLPGCEIGRMGRSTTEFTFCARDDDDARDALERLSSAIEAGIWARDIPLHLVSRFGALRMEHRLVREEDLDAAECALLSARETRQSVCIDCDSERVDPAANSLLLMRDLRDAITRGELALHYQPKLNCRTDRIDAVEALLRWPRPGQPPVNIAELIEAAESTGVILELSRWVVTQAVADHGRMLASGCDVAMNVNLSAALLIDAEFIGWLIDAFAAAEGRLGVEITETALMSDANMAIAQIERLVSADIRIAIDDYGTGFSSLTYLQRLPINELKIDRCFITDIADSNRNPLIIRSTIDLAHALEMQVTAEGVEDPMAIALLRAMGCDVLQGYGIARPMPLDALVPFLKEWRCEALDLDLPSLLTGREAKQS